MVWGDISYNSRYLLVFLQGKVKNIRYIAQVVNPVLLSFIRQEVDVLFQHDDAAHMRLLRHNMLLMMFNNCSGYQDPQIFRQ